jgi:uncharacterized phage infection (PIP) family protein YhgE
VNKNRRKTLAAVATRLRVLLDVYSGVDGADDLRSDLESVRDEEQGAYDNLPESLQEGEQGQKMTAAVEKMEEALGALDDFESALEELSSKLGEAADAVDAAGEES